MIKGWTDPMITGEDGTTSLKWEVQWIDVEDNEALENSKAFNSLDKRENSMLKTMNICTISKIIFSDLFL
jgi:hypothetical protein